MTNTKKVEMTLEEQLEYVKQNWKKITKNWKKITKTHAVVLKAEDDGYKTNYSIELIVLKKIDFENIVRHDFPYIYNQIVLNCKKKIEHFERKS